MSKYASYILYLLLSVLVVILYINDFGPMASLQRSLNDTLQSINAPEGVRPNIALVTIDRKAMDKFGAWPWNRDLVADLLAATAQGEPKTIVAAFDVSEDAIQDSAGHTRILAEQLGWIKNVVLPYDIAIANFRNNLTNNPEHLFDFSLTVETPLGLMNEKSSLQVTKVFLPADKVLQAKPYLGFDYVMPSDDRVLRYQPLVMNFEGYYYPSLDLLAASVFLGVPSDAIRITEGQQIEVGNARTIPTNESGEMLVSFTDGRPYAMYSAADVLDEGFTFERFKGKVVIVGVDDPASAETFDTPVGDAKTRLLVRANVIDNIINDHLVAMSDDHTLFDILILFLLGGVCAAVLPQVSTMYRMVVLLVGFVILANVNYFMLTSFMKIPQTIYFGLELLLFMIASPFADSALLTGQSTSTSKPKLPARAGKGSSKTRLEDVPVREIKSTPGALEDQETEAVSVKSGKVKAAGVGSIHDHQTIALDSDGPAEDSIGVPFADEPEDRTSTSLAAWDDSGKVTKPKPKDDRKSKSGPVEAAIISANTPAGSGADDIELDDSFGASGPSDSGKLNASPTYDSGRTAPELTQLGRYKVTGTLGRGAMGQVYKGVDPAINRPVALKTIRLDFVNDPQEMEELRERLHREAQAAGKLSHPNIVTIYDVGSEGHLQYIAMEYLEGQTLEEMIKKKTTFNFKIIAKIIIQICSALEYAHDRGIVHRDIKPANIMILKDFSVKVMDFGIARVDSNSMTKTGIAMGTPNYISPEQLQGLPVDQRADLFSLGVLMYELLIGKRPFKGENITSLIYAILNHEPVKPSEADHNIPPIFDHIIGKALKKNPAERYQKSSDVVTDLFDFVESFASR